MASLEQTSPKAKVRALIKSLETGDPRAVAAIHPDKYIQHNLSVSDGFAGLSAMMRKLPKGSARASTMRVFQDGEFVFAHTDYNFFGPKIGFDIFRFEDGKIVEHWDNFQAKPLSANPSGHTMTDGPFEATDLVDTQANKQRVSTFVEQVLVRGQVERLAEFYEGDRYIQHNPRIADGVSGLGRALETMAMKGAAMKYERVHRVLGEGNFVLVVSEGHLGDEHVAFYDLFRLERGKIVEHWDTIEAIPPREAWKTANGKF